jgi:ADP-ribose pyrophosphatase
MDTKTPDAQTVYSGKIFSIERIKHTLPNGLDKVYELINIQNAVTILPIDEQNQVYFVEQFRIGVNGKLLELPAGKIEGGEDPAVTANRELREEIGLAAKEMRHLGNFYMTPGYASEYMYCYLATGLYQAPLSPDDDEFVNIHKIPLADVRCMIHDGKIEDSKTLAEPFLK